MTTITTHPPVETSRRAPSPKAQRAKRGKTIRRIALGAGGLLVVGALAAAFRPRPLEVEVARVTRGDLLVTVDEMGRARVRDRYVVSAPIGGNVLRLELKAGDEIAAKDVAARIVPMQPMLLDARSRAEAQARFAGAESAQKQARAAIARAELASQHASDELDRARRLAMSNSIAPTALTSAELEARLRVEELASARFAERMAANEVETVRAVLRRFDPASTSSDSFDVCSPVTGRVLRVLKESAGPVQAGTPLVELGDPGALELVSDVLSADAVSIAPGAPVKVERWGGETLAAHVRRVEPSAFTRLSALGVEEQRVPVVIDLDSPRVKWATLGDGFRVEVRIVTADKRAVAQVPLASVFRGREGWSVFAVRDGRARIAAVELGARSDTAVEITRGIAEGETVLVHPGERVADGSRVTARQ
jgi:HlyD family secretion protein